MTSTVSTDKGFFLKYYLYKLGVLKAHTVFSVIFSVLFLPAPVMLLGTARRMLNSGSSYQVVSFAYMLMILSLLVLSALCLVTPSFVYSYYNKTDKTDMYGALPLTRMQRFWGDWLAGLSVCLIPVTVFGVPSVMAAHAIFSDVFSWDDWGKTLKLFFMVLLCLAAIYIISVFVAVCCGKASSSVVFSVFVMGALPAIVGMSAAITYSRCQGVDIYEMVQEVLRAIPPVGTAVSFLANSGVGIVDRPLAFLTAVLILAAFTVGSCLLAKHRRAERTGRQFAYNAAYHIITVILLIAVFEAVIMLSNSYASGVLAGVIAAVALVFTVLPLLFLELLHYRSFKKLWIGLVKYVACAGASVLIYILLLMGGGFGAAYYVPEASDVERVTVYFQNVEKDFSFEMNTDDRECVQLAADCHRRVIPEATRQISYSPSEISFAYLMYDGTVVSRQYYVEESDLPTVTDMFDDAGGFGKTLSFTQKDVQPDCDHVVVPSMELPFAKLYNEKDRRELLEALAADTAKDDGTGEMIGYVGITTEHDERVSDYFVFDGNVIIKDNYTETLKVLERLGEEGHPTDPLADWTEMELEVPDGENGRQQYILVSGDQNHCKLVEELAGYMYADPDAQSEDHTGIRIRYFGGYGPMLSIKPRYQQKAAELLASKYELPQPDGE